ncbi:hypothetical protein H0S70_07095 [Chryseobacterium manosquense]|uniref:Uncharacterized protein n=1 Tax=Chryseobacterium manosquense TaxID=2754694 RepID=A0A7H1DT64_9FLAO|nr:hypothetical protein [Chryseobacterium manosquense]QNS40172.1 hypothetical protein H0S70_07095 [Chryseobacterium manosquense]
MKTLQEIKNNYAQEHGCKDWQDLIMKTWSDDVMEKYYDEICIRAQKEYGEKIKESVSIFIESDLTVDDIFIDDYVNIISKITDPENLIL